LIPPGSGGKIHFMWRADGVKGLQRGGVMSERKITSARTALCRVVCVLLLAASAAACDACGDIRLQGGQQPEVCRDGPKIR
jgi:hypothetical protein